MSELETVTLGAVVLDEETNAPRVQADMELEGEDKEPFGEVDLYGALGVTALPHPASEDGHAEGILARGTGNSNGAIVASRDTRTAQTTAELGPGETCVHATGPDFEARTFYKDGVIAHIVDDNFVVVQDAENESYTVAAFGMAIQMSRKGGIVLETGGAGISIKNGVVHIRGKVILGGMAGSPATAVLYGSAGFELPAPGVFIGL
jgi:hypothetical protein